jgi:hypothetical protein
MRTSPLSRSNGTPSSMYRGVPVGDAISTSTRSAFERSQWSVDKQIDVGREARALRRVSILRRLELGHVDARAGRSEAVAMRVRDDERQILPEPADGFGETLRRRSAGVAREDVLIYRGGFRSIELAGPQGGERLVRRARAHASAPPSMHSYR